MYAILSGENPEDVTLDPREDRQVVPAGYAADGVCGGRCPTDADDAPDAFIDAAVAAVREWQSRNEPLGKRAVDDLRSRFAREPGEPAVCDNSHGARCVHLREVEATELGVWVADADVALVDLDDDVRFADLHAVPVGDDDEDEDKYVPLVVAADGFFGEVAASFHEHYHALQRVCDRLDAAGPILTDGGSGDDSPLTRSQWNTLLTDANGRTHGDVVRALQDADMVSVEDPDQCVDDAIADGPLEEDPDAGMFPHIYLSDEPEPAEPADTDDSEPEEPDSDSTKPRGEAKESDPLAENIARVGGRVYPDGIKEREWWVSWILDEVGRKRPVAPWKDGHAYPTEWRGDLPEKEKPHTDFETAKRWVDFDLADTGLALPPDAQSDELDLGILLPNDRPALEDRISLIDWDDVRDPDTGEIHPVAAEYLLEYGGYVEVSTSGKGLHQFVEGGLRKRGKFIAPIDDEPFVGDDLPQVEIYDGGRHVAMTGRHVEGTDRHIIENQSYIDSLVSDYAAAEKDAGHRVYDPESDEYERNNTLDTDTDASDTSDSVVPEPQTGEYMGPPLSALQETKPEDRSLAYHATVETFYRGGGNAGGHAHIQNWRLEGFAAALGERADLTREQVKDDLARGYLDDTDVECGCRHETPHRVDYAYTRAETDRLEPPSYSTLVAYGILPPEVTSDGGDADEEYRSDPTDLTATVSAKRAWDAAGRVSPRDLTDHELPVNDDAGSFACPCCGEPVDVVRAVAIDTGLVDSCEHSLDETYPTAYDRARSLGAPLPEYYTTTDAIARFDALLDVIGEVTYWDLDTDALNSEITGSDDDVSGDAVRTLNPSWRESDSGASVLVFPSGTIWDAVTERVLDAVRFVAVDSGLIEDPTAPVEGELFTEAYRRCRNHYDAPLPRWDPAGGDRTITPDLPDGRDLVDTRDVDGVNIDRLDDARERVENMVGELVSVGEDEDNIPTVVTSPPATGKTTATVKSARDGPRAYLPPRLELQQQAVDKADRWGVDSYILPVFSEESVRSEIIEKAVDHVRVNSKDCLRNRWALVNAVVGAADSEDNIDASDIFEEEDDDSVDLDRATCPVADGDYGVAWALAVHVAHRLGYRPGEIHGRAKGLFGAELPCCEDGSCEYGKAWEDVRDPDNCPDLLVGSYTQAHVESVRTYYERDSTGGIDRSPRTVVLDEFPGEAFAKDLGPEAFDFATWLARSLRGDIDDRRDMFDADLYSDDWVRAWLKGTIGDDRDSDSDNDDPIVAEVERVIQSLSRVGELLDARDSAAEILSEYRGAVEELGVAGILTEFVDGTTPEDEVYRALEDLTEASINPDLQGIYEWIHRDVHEPLARATDSGTEPADAGIHTVADTDLPIGGDLASSLESAIDAANTRGDAARERIRAAIESLRGGPDGCRQLAAWADDGYAHPDAHHILTGIITPTDDDSDIADTEATRINTSSWAFDPSADDGTVMDVVSTAGNATTIVDRNDHGARLHTPPSRVAGNGEKAPLVGLDATGRAILWRVVLGEEVQTTDIFDSERDRRQFLEDTLDLRVIQAANKPRFYEGDPATKDTDGDAALLQAIAEEYSGIQAPRQRGEEPERFGSPAAITTKRIREVLESDPRLDDVVATWDNYGNVTGKNELGEHRLAAILGCQHFGDDAIEQFAALAGEEVDTDHLTGRGPDLDYESDVANAYLKHMTEDKTMQAILRFARGEDGGATVVARTSALRDDLPVVGRGEVVETWSDTATNIVKKAPSLGDGFTSADVRDAVDVGDRQVRRVLGELVDAGYLAREDGGPGRAHSYERIDDPGAGEVSIPDRDEAVPDTETFGQSSSNTYYTRKVRVFDPDRPHKDDSTLHPGTYTRAPPAPGTIEGVGPPG